MVTAANGHSLNRGVAFAHGHKKALLIGINYAGTDHALKGCIADVKHMQQFLISHRGYKNEKTSMIFMSDEAVGEHHKPTFKNLVAGFQWLVSGNRPGDSLFLHYSGHGAQMKSATHPSGQIDCLVPLDYQTAGCIDSDLLHKFLVHALPTGVKLTVIFDCCHSGTMLELPYTYHPDTNSESGMVAKQQQVKEILSDVTSLFTKGFSFSSFTNNAQEILHDVAGLASLFHHRPDVDVEGYKHEHFTPEIDEDNKNEKLVVVISGCRDDQTSADTIVQGYGSTGALSYAVQEKLKECGAVTYEGMLQHVREFMARSKLSQIPQLSCGQEVDPDGSFEF
ncbi:peptidase C14, caspase domain-containing protein [Obelidium mucronatum]|nr:peptidase C14, caspase domain-containing protein [Obelidium mucronatum]